MWRTKTNLNIPGIRKKLEQLKVKTKKKKKILKACLIKNQPTHKQQNIEANMASKILSKNQ